MQPHYDRAAPFANIFGRPVDDVLEVRDLLGEDMHALIEGAEICGDASKYVSATGLLKVAFEKLEGLPDGDRRGFGVAVVADTYEDIDVMRMCAGAIPTVTPAPYVGFVSVIDGLSNEDLEHVMGEANSSRVVFAEALYDAGRKEEAWNLLAEVNTDIHTRMQPGDRRGRCIGELYNVVWKKAL